MKLRVGDTAPNFSLPGTAGTFTLSAQRGKGPLILFFYPKNNTRVCTAEACSFRDEFAHLRELNATIVGISADSLKSHEDFKARHKLPYELLSDSDTRVARLYGAKMPLLPMTKRVTFLLDANLVVRAVHSELFGHEGHISSMKEELARL